MCNKCSLPVLWSGEVFSLTCIHISLCLCLGVIIQFKDSVDEAENLNFNKIAIL